MIADSYWTTKEVLEPDSNWTAKEVLETGYNGKQAEENQKWRKKAIDA